MILNVLLSVLKKDFFVPGVRVVAAQSYRPMVLWSVADPGLPIGRYGPSACDFSGGRARGLGGLVSVFPERGWGVYFCGSMPRSIVWGVCLF